MKKKNNIPVSALIEIERQVERKNETGELSYTTLSKLMHDGAINCDVLAQAIDMAIVMPKKEIEVALEEYDSSHPKMDAVKFVNELAKKYDVKRNDVILRIQYVRRINRVMPDKTEQRRKEIISKLKGE